MFLHLPADGWPKVIDASPTLAYASDLLGGTVNLWHAGDSEWDDRPLNLAVITSETNLEPLNLAASAVCTFLINKPVCIPGPAVISCLNTRATELVTGAKTGLLTGVPAELANCLVGIAEDTLYADADAINMMGTGSPVRLDDQGRRDYLNISKQFIAFLRQQWADRVPDFGKASEWASRLGAQYRPAEAGENPFII
jgi:hypothetical protein